MAQYEGQYVAEAISADNQDLFAQFQLTGRPDGALQQTFTDSGEAEAEDDLGPGVATDLPSVILTFYANDYVINESTGARSDFLRDESGAVVWLRSGGRLYRRGS